MRPFLQLTHLLSVRIALAVATVLGFGLCASRLLGLHGVESALVLGIVLPPLVSLGAASVVADARRRRSSKRASRLLASSLVFAVATWVIPVLILALNSLRVRQCQPLEGLGFMALGPGVGCLLAAVVGASSGSLSRHAPVGKLLALGVPLVAIVIGLWSFYSTPAIFVYSHFVGWFPGTIYDEGVVIGAPYLSFRVVTLAWMVALSLWFTTAHDPALGRSRWIRILAAPGRLVLVVALLFGAVFAGWHGPDLGHGSTPDHMAAALGAEQRGERCTVHAPRETPSKELERLAHDCDFRVEEAERLLGVEQRAHVSAFFFRSADEKRRHMGAATTFIAKPWRNEVYLQQRGWPHPVLAHEIAHVVAGNMAEGPFLVGGSAGGWLPDPALIEGVAVAVAWDVRDGLTPHQWARAMADLGEMPDLHRVFGLSFLSQPASNAYTVAGSFLRFVLDRYGKEVVQRAYRTGDTESAAGKPLRALEGEWHEFLATVDLPDSALALARLRFSKASVFSAVCPHAVAQLRLELGGHLAAGDDGHASSTCEALLDIDPNDTVTRAYYVGLLSTAGHEESARRELEALEGAPPPVITLARQLIADATWRRGDGGEALAMYRALLEEPQTDDAARQLEVKLLGLTGSDAEAELVFDLLLGLEGTATSAPVAVHLAHKLAAVREDGLGAYLEARQLVFAGRYDRALPLLHQVSSLGLPTARLRKEARRLLGIALYTEVRRGESRRVWERIIADEESTEGDRVEARDWLQRLR